MSDMYRPCAFKRGDSSETQCIAVYGISKGKKYPYDI